MFTFINLRNIQHILWIYMFVYIFFFCTQICDYILTILLKEHVDPTRPAHSASPTKQLVVVPILPV